MSDNKDIISLEEGFSELQHYSDNQFKTIVELQSKLARLESENKSLKDMLEQNLPSIGLDGGDFVLGISNEQLICETQLLNLKNAAVVRDLTMEEAKKVQIFTDILFKIKNKNPESEENSVRNLSPAELLTIVNGNG